MERETEKKSQRLKKLAHGPPLVWLTGLGIVRQTRGHWFDSQSGHMCGLQSQSPFEGVREAIDGCSLSHRCFSPSRLPTFPSL